MLRPFKRDRWLQTLRSQQAAAIVAATVAVAIATLAGRLFSAMAPLPNISMVFLLAVLFSAVSFGMRLAIYASILSFLAYNFFFIEPLYTFQITEPSRAPVSDHIPDRCDRDISPCRTHPRSSSRGK